MLISHTESASGSTFLANRAAGHIRLSVAASGGVTRRAEVSESGSLRVRFPHGEGDVLEAVIVNTGGGMTGGDRFTVGMTVGAGAQLVAGTTAAEKIYRTTGPATEMDVTLTVAAGGRLSWLPQETILFDRARLSRHIDVDVAAGGSAILAEAVVFGRTAMGETLTDASFTDRWRVRHGGRLVYADTARLGGAVAAQLSRPAVAKGGIAVATVLIVPASEDECALALEHVRALGDTFAGDVGISAWNGIAVARLVAGDGAALRRDLIAVLVALGTTVPRLWLQ